MVRPPLNLRLTAGALDPPAQQSILKIAYAAFNSDVQFGHFVAGIGIDVAQYGQFFVVGAAGLSPMSRFIHFTKINTANAIITKSMIVLRKTP
jgi:hypothetical protein